MKTLAPETIRLMQAAADTRGSLCRLAARIAAAGEDAQLRSEAPAAAHQVATTHADLLRLPLKDLSARRHSTMISEAQPLWAVSRESSLSEPPNNDKKTPRDCWRTRYVSASCDVCGARPEVVHIPMDGKGFRCPEHCENCAPAASNREGELPRK